LEPVTVKRELDDDEKENGFPMNPKPTGWAAARKKENKAHKKAAHCDGKGSSDEDSDGELRILSDLRLSLCEFVESRTRRDRLKAAKELFEVEPTDVNKQNYIQALRELASPPALAKKAPQLHHTKRTASNIHEESPADINIEDDSNEAKDCSPSPPPFKKKPELQQDPIKPSEY
jgi:hypothetical protein